MAQAQEVAEIRFLGPAGDETHSFNKASEIFLDNYSKNYKNYENPESSIHPPIFNFHLQDVSDETFREITAANCDPGISAPAEILDLVKNRVSDEAEYVVFRAIDQLAQDKIQAPFIGVHNFDLKLNLDEDKGRLTKILPELNWTGTETEENWKKQNIKNALRTVSGIAKKGNAEFDFIIIGPKIGFVVIEVKSSNFNRKDFQEGKKRLPRDYSYDLKQLKTVDVLIHHILEKCTRLEIRTRVRKILFLSNLKRSRHETWINSLSIDSRPKVDEDVTLWFKEDMENKEKGKAPLYEKLRDMLNETTVVETMAILYEINLWLGSYLYRQWWRLVPVLKRRTCR